MLAMQYLKVLGIALMVVAGVPQVKAQVPAPVTNGDIAPPRMIAGKPYRISSGKGARYLRRKMG